MTDDLLTTLLADAVADVEPADRLEEIRARIEHADRGHRGWWIAGGGAALAVAASVTVVAVTTTPREVSTTPPPPLGSPTSSPTSTAPPSAESAVAAYFVGQTPSGGRLYREFQRVASPSPGLAGLALLESGPRDPDYSSLWPRGSFEERISDPEASIVHVFLGPGAPAHPSALAEQQVVYTLSAGFQEPLSVVFHRGDATTAPVSAEPVLDTLSRVNLTTPEEGATVSGSTLDVEGVANSFEANVPWLLEDEAGNDLANGAFTATGWMDTKLFPFQGSIDVSSLDPGRYSLIVFTDDASGGSEGPGASSDSRTIVIE